MKTISGAPLQTSQGPGPITAFVGAPALGIVYADAAGVVRAHPTATLNAAGALSIGAVTSSGGISHGDTNAIVRTGVALLDGAGVGIGTLLNAPAAGNPTKWVPLIDNGVTRYIPAW